MNSHPTTDRSQWLAHYKDAHLQQEKFLLDLVNDSKNTALGMQLKFRAVRSIRDFQSTARISTYADLEHLIQQILTGKTNVLSPFPVTQWITTSGTTGKPKLYPYNQKFEAAFWSASYDMINNLLFHLGAKGKQLLKGETVIIHAADVSQTAGEGVTRKPVSFFSNWMARQGQRSVSQELIEIQQLEDWDEKMLSLAVYFTQRNVTYLSGITPFVLTFLQRIERAFDGRLVERLWGINKARARELESVYAREGKLPIPSIWRNITCLSLGGVNPYLYKNVLHQVVPDCPIFQSYIGSEGFHGFQYEGGSPLMALQLNSAFYEFIEVSDYRQWRADPVHSLKRLTVADVEVDIEYVMCVTNHLGLVAYVIGDVIRIRSRSPILFEYAGRIESATNLAGEKVSESQLTATVMEAMSESRYAYSEFIGLACVEPKPHYAVLIEADLPMSDASALATDLDRRLCKANLIYFEARKMGGLDPLKLVVLEREEFSRYMIRLGALGQWNLGQMKLPKLSTRAELLDSLSSKATVVSQFIQ